MKYSFHDSASGEFSARHWSGPASQLPVNTPPGFTAIEGEYDCRLHRIENGEVVVHKPPKPDDTSHTRYEWDDSQGWVGKPTDARTAVQVRADRSMRLAKCDWVALRALETAKPMEPAWFAYRQLLRDVPAQPGFPNDIAWPVSPQ